MLGSLGSVWLTTESDEPELVLLLELLRLFETPTPTPTPMAIRAIRPTILPMTWCVRARAASKARPGERLWGVSGWTGRTHEPLRPPLLGLFLLEPPAAAERLVAVRGVHARVALLGCAEIVRGVIERHGWVLRERVRVLDAGVVL